MPTRITSDELHNQNCYRYLQKLVLPVDFFAQIPELSRIQAIQGSNDYNEYVAYGTLYTKLMSKLDALLVLEKLKEPEWDDFFISIYQNHNKNLENTYENIKEVILEKSPSSPLVEHTIKRKIRDAIASVNYYTPAQQGSLLGVFTSMVHPYFKPSHKTSLATVRQYRYNRKGPSQELHFGTQGQYNAYFAQTNPIFRRFLHAQSRKSAVAITHVYFNNMPNEHNTLLYQKFFEVGLSCSLEDLENQFPNCIVVTLPADNALLNHQDLAHPHTIYNKKTSLDLFLKIALEEGGLAKNSKDFHISPGLRRIVFGSKENEKKVLRRLLNESFCAMGLDDRENLSVLQRQAVWGHFVKFELPKYILAVIKPHTYNFACKDAIDRAGSSSAYYHLLNSFATDHPMSRDEFERALHAGPAMAKGRGMNHNLKIIWNLIDYYISAHPNLVNSNNKKWLIDWRDANCPNECMGNLLERRLEECIEDLEKYPNLPIAKQALDVLKSIQVCDRSHAKNHALLLDVVISTYAFYQKPQLLNNKNLSRYENLIQKMKDCDEQPISWLEAFLRFLRALFCMKQPQKVHSGEYARLISKMGTWQPISQNADFLRAPTAIALKL